ncbi:MAG: cupin domain-containing protein [Clostridia bacterium]|nr:cupin domain-containing protein [Clostridia bacterium]
MVIDLMNTPETAMPNFKGGEGVAYARMFFDGQNRMMLGRLPVGSSIGMHTHETNSEIMHVVSGAARVIMDGAEEIICAGQTHYCPKGHTHMTMPYGNEELVIFSVVPEQ